MGKEHERKEFEGVFIIRAGEAAFRPVKTGIASETRVQVLSGLEEGMEIVTGSYKALRELQEGDKVKVEAAT